MTVRSARVVVLVSLAALGVACESTKSANPLSPSVAGPIPGVEISAPKPLEPGVNWEVSNDKQPLMLLIENPGSNGQRPVTIEVEVAADEGFSTKVFAKAGIEPGANGRTELRLPSKLTSDRTYFWRAKGQDGANHGPWSAAVRFSIFTPATLLAPVPVSPGGGTTVGSLEPEFTFHNAPRSGPIGSITYLVEISGNDSFTALVATYTGAERNGPGGDTSIRVVAPLPSSSTLFWRVRAWDGSINGPWSSTQVFQTGAGPAPAIPAATRRRRWRRAGGQLCLEQWRVHRELHRAEVPRRTGGPASAATSAAPTWSSCATASSKRASAAAWIWAGT